MGTAHAETVSPWSRGGVYLGEGVARARGVPGPSGEYMVPGGVPGPGGIW